MLDCWRELYDLAYLGSGESVDLSWDLVLGLMGSVSYLMGTRVALMPLSSGFSDPLSLKFL